MLYGFRDTFLNIFRDTGYLGLPFQGLKGGPESLHAFEPPHDKTNKVTVSPAKTQISLGIRPV